MKSLDRPWSRWMKSLDRPWSRCLKLHALVLSAFFMTAHPAVGLHGGEDTSLTPARAQFFEQKVRPLLAENCYSCHGPAKQKGGLRLDSREAILKGGETGPAVVPGKPDASLLLDAVQYDGPEMPPAGKLETGKIEILTRWIALGAPWPPGSRDIAPTLGGAGSKQAQRAFTTTDRGFWSFQPVRSPLEAEHSGAYAPPPGEPWADWARTPIDRFILKGLLAKGLTPAPPADRWTLIRRATFDLTGLPPTPEEIDAFVNDSAPGAYERLIDRLLASPRYGQRWGRHWLDLVRYAESDGHRQDAYRPGAWRYRDYVVRSFNRDKPYDRFLTEQLAGDELDPHDLELRVATGYLRLGTYEFNQRNVRAQWDDILNDLTDVTGEVFLGLGIGCARCHDHKFDPILQKDYYRLQAFFTPLLQRDDLPLMTSAELTQHAHRTATWERATADLRCQIAQLERPYRERAARGALAKFPDDIKAILAKSVKDRTPLEIQLGALAYRQVALEHAREPALRERDKTRVEDLYKLLRQFEHLKPAPPDSVLAATDVGAFSPPTLIPGTHRSTPVVPGFLTILDSSPARIEHVSVSAATTGRRLTLARWLSSPANPLSSRVIVNRVWQYHFGRGLTATSSDFGRLGEAPSHPELLDWLAGQFMAGGSRLKTLHRMIMTSAVYCQSSERSESEVEFARRIDPDNRLLWKRGVQRLDAEEIRDAMLAVSGELEPTIGGPSADVKSLRRAVDTKVIRNSRDALLDAFDAPDGYASTGRRNVTTTPTQALLLINGAWPLERARAFASRLERFAPRSAGNRDHDRIVQAFRLALGRAPEAEEWTRVRAFLADQSRRVRPRTDLRDREALVDFCHTLLNSSEFLYID
jgi:hypothetical protein